ncbi:MULTISPECIES: alpha/beta fold hydrolase [Halomonadaceae]|uniref:Alpha/beta hydrolase n=1 Tax=Vreelandella titanicae TaxID=664683 RepID=A0A558JE36_9GAMM|nr:MULTISPECIES: alpha/beta hydrolase [Halomonas]QHB80164.1 ab hydrolase RhlA [synthetic construct]TVU91904.1 alpha/beta hydrolase [Halomonas titanicae]CEP34302.1 (R)-3-hydroxydecanoyl-ACP:CoA transacylase [Halomonas sp. R57-5]
MKANTDLVKIGNHCVHVETYQQPQNTESIIMVNGALATTASFTNCVKYLNDGLNVILFDLPFAGQSKPHNPVGGIITKDDEVNILLALIERYQPTSLLSVSWGGYAAMMALAQSPTSIKRAVLASFSTQLNDGMLRYINGARHYIQIGDVKTAANLLNEEVGKYLPRLLKYINYRHLSRLDDQELQQVCFHIEQILSMNDTDYEQLLGNIEIPTLFVNGKLDEYTTPEDILIADDYMPKCAFEVVPNAGHFLDLEHADARQRMEKILRGFLIPGELERQVA